jgi:protein-tyrosine-phosphatase
MAEYLARDRLADDTVTFASAGTAALAGRPASEATVRVMREIGIDVSAHRSRDVWELADTADFVYALTTAHYADLESRWPTVRIEVLDPDGRSIADPCGLSMSSYRRARVEIEDAVSRRLEEWTGLAS